jgi:hypothetical protein
MKRQRQTRQDERVLTAKTGEDFYDPEASVSSDVGAPLSEATTAHVVGRTPVDLLYERQLSSALARFIDQLDPVEVLGTLVYVLLGVWGKSSGLEMRFWVFVTSLAGYHVLLKPIAKRISSWAGKYRTNQPDDLTPRR